MHPVLLKPDAFFNLYWAHISITCHRPRMSGDSGSLQHCLQQGFIPRGPTFRVPEYLRTFTQAWVILPSLPAIDATAPSLSPTTVPKLLSTAIKTPLDVCLRSSLLAAL